MDVTFVKTPEIQKLLDTAAGIGQEGGDTRLKGIVRDLTESIMEVIVKHDISEDEFWGAIKFFADGAGELGLIAPGSGLEHFMDLYMDAKDAEAGLSGGTPRTIEGPLYVSGAPLVENGANLTSDPDPEADNLTMTGAITGPDGEPVKDAVVHVWHANSQGWYSHFDPTTQKYLPDYAALIVYER
mgnify:FL=1